MTQFHEVMLYTDGASRGNPGLAAAAFRVIDDGGKLVDCGARVLGHATNNVAEYQALLDGLRCCIELGVRRVRWVSDSEAVVNQVLGRNKVKAPGLRPLHDEVLRLRSEFDELVPIHHRRAHPEIAATDRAANAVLDAVSANAPEV